MTPSHQSHQSQSSGRVVKIHLACRASIPIGSHLRVTGAHIWDPTETGSPDDPSNAAAVASQIGQSAYDRGKLGLGGMVVNEDEAAQTGDGLNGSVLERQALHGGIHDDRSSWHASSIEMVTSPKTYPLWRTRRPVIVTLTDPEDGRDMEKVIQHQYRYLVATPGSENDGPHGLPAFESLQETDSFSMKKISSSGVALNAMTSGNDGTVQFPVTLWENPPAFNDSFGARPVNSEATTSVQGSEKPKAILSNLCYRTLEIDTLNGNVIKPPGTNEFTEDGVLVDNWNRADDASFQAYAEREKVRIESLADSAESAPNNPDTVTPVATRRQIHFVCYHLPVSVSKNARGEWQVAWSESILANLVGNNLVGYTPHWVGTVRTDGHTLTDRDRDELTMILASMDCTVIFFESSVRDKHFYGFCKQVLWEVFHYVDLVDIQTNAFGFDLDVANDQEKSTGTIHDLRSLWDQSQVGEWWAAYNTVNQTFANIVGKMASRDDVIWVNDYHLALLPSLLLSEETRTELKPTQKIFYLHIPFPSSRIFLEMECGESILRSMLSVDLIAFHGFSDARHFQSCAKRALGLTEHRFAGGLIGLTYRKRNVAVTMNHVPVEADEMDGALKQESTLEFERSLRSKHKERKIICGINAAQYLSGLTLKLLTYEKFLSDAPAWRDKVVLVQRCIAKGDRCLDEKMTLREVRVVVDRIMKRFGHEVIDFEEVSSVPIEKRLAMWKVSDCFFSTEIRGGLSLWPMEYVYVNGSKECPGVLIVSEFTAACSILNGALRISPHDLNQTLKTLDRALSMSIGERRGRSLRDIEWVSSSSASSWIQKVIRDLKDSSPDEEAPDEKATLPSKAMAVSEFLKTEREERFTRLNPSSVLSAYKSTSKRVIVLDFNGTIVIKEAVDSFHKRSQVGSAGDGPPQAAYAALEKLCLDDNNTVFVISGDMRQAIESSLGNIKGLGLASSNGSCFSPPTKQAARSWLALDIASNWEEVKKKAIQIMSKFTALTNGSHIKLAHSSIGWSYFDCDPEWGSLQAKHLVLELEDELARFDVRFVNLKGIVEVMPREFNKGVIVTKILRDAASRNNGVEFVLCMGDDISDEKMFTSVMSYVSERGDDYNNVTPSPPVIQLSQGFLPASQPLLTEAPLLEAVSDDPMFAFTVAVGKKPSHASQYVDKAEDVADLLVKLAAGSLDEEFVVEKVDKQQQMHFA